MRPLFLVRRNSWLSRRHDLKAEHAIWQAARMETQAKSQMDASQRFCPQQHAPYRGTARDKRGETGEISASVRKCVPVMNTSVSPKLAPGTRLHRQLSLFEKHGEESPLTGRVS